MWCYKLQGSVELFKPVPADVCNPGGFSQEVLRDYPPELQQLARQVRYGEEMMFGGAPASTSRRTHRPRGGRQQTTASGGRGRGRRHDNEDLEISDDEQPAQ